MLHGAEVGGFSFVLTVWWGKVAPPKVESDGVDKRRGEKKRKKRGRTVPLCQVGFGTGIDSGFLSSNCRFCMFVGPSPTPPSHPTIKHYAPINEY